MSKYINFLLQVIMFWIVDSILMHKRKNGKDDSHSIQYHRSSARYNRLKYDVESCSDSDSSENVTVTPKNHHHDNGMVLTETRSHVDSTEL